MKKILALTLAAAMTLALAACGGGTGSSAASSGAGSDTSNPSSAASSQGSDSSAAGNAVEFGTTYNTIEEGILRMSTDANFPPYVFPADGEGICGGYEGIDIEIAAALADKLGLELVVDAMDFTSSLLAVQSNKGDMTMSGLTYKPDRDEVMDFSTSYATGVQVVIVPDGSDIEALDDLEGKMIGTQLGTTGYEYAAADPEDDGFGEDYVLGYENGALAVQAMLNGQVDAVIIDNGPAQEYVKANPGTHILDTEWVIEDYCLAVDEGNITLLEALNAALEEMIADGSVQTIVDKYITD